MSVKLLLSGLSNVGKTRAISKLEKALIIAIDGKKYPHAQMHKNISSFETMEEFLKVVNESIGAYEAKLGEYPKTIVFDTVTKIFEVITNKCNAKYQNFDIHTNISRWVAMFNDYIEDTLIANDVNVVIISHATYNKEQGAYELPSSGAFAKKGGFLSTVDNASYLEVKGGKYIISHCDPKRPSRTTLSDMPVSQPADEYNIAHHIAALEKVKSHNAEFSL